MLTIVKTMEFHAAHYLPNYNGPCRNVHGHSYKLEIGVCAPDKQLRHLDGMVMDFAVLKSIMQREVVGHLDHQSLNDLNDLPGFPCHNPTAENMVYWIVDVLKTTLANAAPLVQLNLVRLWETRTSCCEWLRPAATRIVVEQIHDSIVVRAVEEE